MNVESLFTTKGNKDKAVYTEMARVIESIRFGTVLPDGKNLKDELSESEKNEVENYVFERLMPEIITDVKMRGRRAQLDYSKEEELQSIMMMKVYEEFPKYNKQAHLKEQGLTFELSSFLNQIAKAAMREMMLQERGYGENVIRNLGIVTDAILAISDEKGISYDEVSADMVHEYLKTEKSISYRMVLSLMDIIHGSVSIDDMEDAENRLQDNTDYFIDAIDCEMDEDVKALLDAVFAGFSDFELYILMKEAGFFGEKMQRMTAKELSYRDFFVKLAREDKDGEKNIEFGDVHVGRCGRNSGRAEELFVESVYFVKEKFYNNKVAKIKRKLASLAGQVSMANLEGQLEGYCLNLWKERNIKFVF